MSLPRTVERMAWDRGLEPRLPTAGWPADRRPVITVSRLPGSRGGEVVGRLCEDLEYACYDREIIHEIAALAHLRDTEVAALDERQRPFLAEVLTAALLQEHLSPYAYRDHLVQVITGLARRGGSVIVGRGAHLILPAESALRVLVVAPYDSRVRNVAERHGTTVAEARRRVERIEADRRAFLHQYFHSDPGDTSTFDIVVNTEPLGVAGAVSAIESALHTKATALAVAASQAG